ncbi:MAG: YggS family pyridoxal phosphate-dependent enzyme [Hyphomicrobiaceae bacterium]
MSGNSQSRLAAVNSRIIEVCKSAGRDPASVNLIAVSKTFGADAIRPVLEAGHRRFGENRVQESQAKWPDLKAEFPGVELHLIGPLQSNKAKEAVALFDAIHTIDRLKIAETVAAEMARQGKSLELFVEINTGMEPQKAGISPHDAQAFVAHCRDTLKLPVTGLMCIPPVEEEPAVHFAFLAKMARELDLPKLSMGMSSDYETAIEFGATHVRVGSSIFGHR